MALVLSLLTLVGCSGSSVAASTWHLAGTRLQVDGATHVVSGVTAYVLPFYANDDASAVDVSLKEVTQTADAKSPQMYADMRRMGFNTVRIPITWRPAIMKLYGYDQSTYTAAVVQEVRQAEAAGLDVILAWFDSAGLGSELPGHVTEAFSAMRLVHQALGKNASKVIYEPFNEPNGVSWADWEKVVNATTTFFRDELGHRGVLLVDTIDFSWAFSAASARRVQEHDAQLLGAPAQVLFANHRYANANSCFCGDERTTFTDEVVSQVKNFPILGGEYGNFNEGKSSSSWTEQFLAYLVSDAIPAGLNGAIVFVWQWVDDNSLMLQDGVSLTPYGQQVKASLLKSITPTSSRT